MRADIFMKALLFLMCISILIIFCSKRNITTPNYSELTESVYLSYTYADLNENLCHNISKWTNKKPFNPSKALPCPDNDIVTIAAMGRTGNIIWAYASVLAVSRQTGLRPYIPNCIRMELGNIFESLTIPDFEDIIDCPVFDTYVSSVEEWKKSRKSIILPRYLMQRKNILPWVKNLREEFILRKKLRDFAQKTLKSLTAKWEPRKYTYIGVHVRRTDYKKFLMRKYGESLADAQYFLNAMDYFKKKYHNAVFVFLSDDPHWCFLQFRQLENVFIVDSKNSSNNPAQDLAIIAACNHTIIDYGTFGELGAILAGGETVCYNISQNFVKGTYKLMKNWQLMT